MRHRTRSDHGAFWHVAQRTFDNWPEQHPFRPTTKEHLIGYILIEVGYSECRDVENIGHDDERAVKAVARAMFDLAQREIHCMRIFPTATGIRICVPQSLKYELAGKRKYEEARAKVYEYIETTLGIRIEQLMHTRIAE